ncbi:Protein of unknown function [Pseudosulfitobacter pseudonitzschiae]|uniref:Gene transfer agent protein n=1 Tax=Pseudosulfitobacter pseudonitzschiae TaxID=1402135 RepID=A0A073IW72_9RHOB|nr:DUF3168 domain-containing protein [Pseudosulfitobacter pseudonitzschiae]KEJ94573.1 gene transfer agent protein [Pseudosulfitobacter pseudonitzschiae]QKS08495.1 DUF3168 domain-containing protein [Pseudosulfitobacter pseudonitzschiae]SHF76108.1 Protein of unknown function [Pseudosulfitobacter pseudonitzschiae]
MSYGVSAALQGAIYEALTASTAVTDLVGTDIYDAVPTGTVPSLYVSIGAETAQAANDKTGTGALHDVRIAVVTDVQGFAAAKAVATAVSDTLHGADLTLTRGRLIYLNFDRAVADRSDAGAGRMIALRFKARVEDA